MAADWYYNQAGNQVGPVSQKELKTLAQSGQIQPTDLVWKNGMSDWKPVSQVKGLLPEPPPMGSPPPLPSGPPPIGSPPPLPPGGAPSVPANPAGFRMQSHPIIWAYQGVLALLLIALLCPWIKAEGSSSVRYGDMGRDMSRQGLGNYGGRQAESMGNQSASASLSILGISTLWGIFILLLIISGVVLSFIGPNRVFPAAQPLFPHQEKALMAAVGGLALLFLLIVLFTAGSYVNQEANVSTKYASSSASASVSWGWYIALIAVLAVCGLGVAAPWKNSRQLS